MLAHENRRGFVRHCFGAGASLAALPFASSQALESGKVESSGELNRMSDYEQILSHTKHMHILGNPRSWSLVSQGLHPFAPERVVVMREQEYFDRGGRDLRRQIDKQIEVEFGHMQGFDKKAFPDCKRESIYWMIDAMCGHYGVPYFSDWVVGVAGREILASTAWFGLGMAHQYQRAGLVAVDNPPVDWWLFLIPGGIDWAAVDGHPVFAVIAHVAHLDASYRAMFPLCFLTQSLLRTAWSQVAQMGRVDACRYLNRITAQCILDLAL
jgi:hypothetical protein